MRILFCLTLILSFAFFTFAQTKYSGKPFAADFTAKSTNGKLFNLAKLKGKVVLLTFWSTRCGICVSEIPKLNRLQENYKDKDVVFLGLTMENESKINNFLRRKPFNFDILPNSFGVVLKYAEKYNEGNIMMGFPAHFIINQKGEIELKTSGFDKTDKLETTINQLLKSNSQKVE